MAQSTSASLRGLVTDSSKAIIADVKIAAIRIGTNVRYDATTNQIGDYDFTSLPPGTYRIEVERPGFRSIIKPDVTLHVQDSLEINFEMTVGSVSESITVQGGAPLLKTESGELSHNVTSQRLDELPILSVNGSFRDPSAAIQLIPGGSSVGGLRVNGSQGSTYRFLVEGGDVSNGFLSGSLGMTQPSVDAIEEMSIQTSNYSAEFGQAGGGLFSLTMKSGTNRFHGSGYDYFVNEALNAAQPFINVKPVNRQNDYGFTLGGPVWLPKVYDGHNKTFFFFNWEEFRQRQFTNNQLTTVPTLAYRAGDFSQALTGRNIGTDPLGRAIIEGAIYDPSTTRPAPNGQVIRDPFPNNKIPLSQMDPVALNIQALIPLPTSSGVVNNGVYPFTTSKVASIPSLKIDHLLTPKAKVSFYWSHTGSDTSYSGGGGLPTLITQNRPFTTESPTIRLNVDYSLTPTLLLHFGGGYVGLNFNPYSQVNDYDIERGLGLKGAPVNVGHFPTFTGLTGSQGGSMSLGPGTGSISNPYISKPTANTSLTWVRSHHVYKAGAEMRLEGNIGRIYTNDAGAFSFSANETALPYLQSTNIGGRTIGFPYASFLLGAVDTVNATPPLDFRLGKQQWGAFIQDSWKVTRRLTLDYGLRYDYSTYLREEHGRVLDFSPTVSNPSAGGLPGAVIFEGSGPGHCNCQFAKNYPYAFGPRLGLAYQINSKTVLRAGWGILYNSTEDVNGAANTLPVTSPVGSSSFGDPAMSLRDGIPFEPGFYQWPNLNPGQFPQGTSLNAPPVFIDRNAGRPARQNQWSIGLQREISHNLVVEASYVGNRGVWWYSPNLIDVNALTPQRIAAAGLDINSATDRSLLTSTLNSSTAIVRGFGNPPYSGFPLGSTVAQSLRPFPQFGSIAGWWAPLGDTWYDSLQTKATKRFSRGLSFTTIFVWSKQLVLGSSTNPLSESAGTSPNDVFNRKLNKSISPSDQPFVFNTSANYILPALGKNKLLSGAVRDWTIGAFFAYSSGLPIASPPAQNNLSSLLFRNTLANRVPGVPLFTQDLNCHCFDPNKTLVLNPAAWTDPAAGQFGTAAPYYSDYRGQRRPTENLSLGRTFRFKERATLNIRVDFTNVFNRTEMGNPSSTNAKATPVTNNAGQYTAGFGWINTASVAAPPRQGTIVARIQF